MNKISIIIPVLNEEKSIAKIINHIKEYISNTISYELIFVDGGSDDGTIQVLETQKANIVQSPKGRALQMNAGAKKATGNILYFLHCDSFPPKNFDQFIVETIEKGKQSGCFRMRFDSKHILLRVSAWFTRFNFLSCRGGDQSLFVTKTLFDKIGGFDENYTIYEDNEIIERLYKQNQFAVIQKNILTSARKYKINGVWRLQFLFAMIHLKRRLGHSPEELKTYYNKNIL
uniref:TIGR04283 family arsenosugar biosynthesis glycosyltransferase n=1 Tax=Flavobacterium sp. TaxID=239 RepID=UPI004048FFA8